MKKLASRAFLALLVLATVPSVDCGFDESTFLPPGQEFGRNYRGCYEVANDELELLEFDFREEGEGLIVNARLYAHTPPSEDLVELWSDTLTKTLKRPVRLSLISIPVSSVESSGE